jgi:hypothetical protein
MSVRADLRALRATLGDLAQHPGEVWWQDCMSDADGLYSRSGIKGDDGPRLTQEEFDALPDDRERMVIVLHDAPPREGTP